MKKHAIFLILYLVFVLGAGLRLYNLNWDSGYHMHPDERAIVLSVIKLAPPASLTEFLSPDSPWNPKFFAYGSLPFYLLYFAGQFAGMFNPLLSQYDGIQLVGRFLSALFDLGTMFFIFLLGKRVLTKSFAAVAVFCYGVSTLPIQLSHFYAVDTPLTFFITGTLYFLLCYLKKPTTKYLLLIGGFFALALATKLSAAVLFLPIGVTFFLSIVQSVKHLAKIPHPLIQLLTPGLLFLVVTGSLYAICQPYAFIDFTTFSQHTREQSQLTRDPFAFPYTLQYVGKIPYLYELKNMFFYGLGPTLALFSVVGILFWTGVTLQKIKQHSSHSSLLLISFFWVYFLVVGSFAVGFMRYMLPLYPILCLAVAFLLSQVSSRFLLKKKNPKWTIIFCSLFFVLSSLIWPLSFMHIYLRTNTRVQATQWIQSVIPPGSTLAIEHWDDALPLTGQEQYQLLTLTLYDPDTPEKWQTIRAQLQQTDYIILASNRLYTPLMKLTHCATLPPGRCYPETAAYYKHLFDGSLGFQRVADITSYPTIPFTNISLPDQGADESFTVYDHPRVLIFKKVLP